MPENQFESFSKSTKLDKLQAKGVVDSGAAQKENQQKAPQKVIPFVNDCI